MKKPSERRRYVRTEIPLKVTVRLGERVEEVETSDISPIGMRFVVGTKLDEAETSGKVQLFLRLPTAENPIRLAGKIAWQRKVSLEDNAPYEVGVEILDVEDEDKNIFLKYLCDLLYRIYKQMP